MFAVHSPPCPRDRFTYRRTQLAAATLLETGIEFPGLADDIEQSLSAVRHEARQAEQQHAEDLERQRAREAERRSREADLQTSQNIDRHRIQESGGPLEGLDRFSGRPPTGLLAEGGTPMQRRIRNHYLKRWFAARDDERRTIENVDRPEDE